MSRVEWDEAGKKLYETGTDRGMLYPFHKVNGYTPGVAWSGLTGVTDSPSGAEPTPLYADNGKYLNMVSAEEFGATITCYMYPDEFSKLNGEEPIAKGVVIGQQNRGVFGFAYRTIIGNDTELNDHGYKLHLIYGATASPSEKAYKSVNDSPEGIEFSYELKTTPVNVKGFKPTATVTIDSTTCDPEKLAALEAILYGTDADDDAGTPGTDPRLPLPDEVAQIMGGI